MFKDQRIQVDRICSQRTDQPKSWKEAYKVMGRKSFLSFLGQSIMEWSERLWFYLIGDAKNTSQFSLNSGKKKKANLRKKAPEDHKGTADVRPCIIIKDNNFEASFHWVIIRLSWA